MRHEKKIQGGENSRAKPEARAVDILIINIMHGAKWELVI
jgi:hypothetical protein